MHRDIKPENMIYESNEGPTIKLGSFSLAESFINPHRIFVRCGTPGYVAPEILNNEAYDNKVDIFSAGIILYNLLTGS